MIEKLIKLGLTKVSAFHLEEFLNTDIKTYGEMYLANVYGEQKLIAVKERQLDNSDGSEWSHPCQTKMSVYYLEDNFEWSYYSDLN
jgi:hypothetical protein